MGNALSRLIASLFGEKEIRILILGLDNAGKTSILYRLKEGTFHSTVPNRETALRATGGVLCRADCLFHKLTISLLLNPESLVPTAIGFNAEQIEVGKLKAQVWDLGGQESIRPYWRSYYQEQEAVIFVVDSCDHDRMEIAKRELMNIIEEEELKNAVVCIFANKQDMPDALTTAEIAQSLGLSSIIDKKWTIIATSALRGDGLKEGFEWISHAVQSKA